MKLNFAVSIYHFDFNAVSFYFLALTFELQFCISSAVSIQIKFTFRSWCGIWKVFLNSILYIYNNTKSWVEFVLLFGGRIVNFTLRNSSPKMKLYSSSGHSRCRWVCFFIRFGEIQHYIKSPKDHLQWMGAVRMRIQTDDKNITIIHK